MYRDEAHPGAPRGQAAAVRVAPSLDQQSFLGPTHNCAHMLQELGRDAEAVRGGARPTPRSLADPFRSARVVRQPLHALARTPSRRTLRPNVKFTGSAQIMPVRPVFWLRIY